ncbi:MAG: glycosyltransferase [Calditrichales bacterium]|nr:glycosyltransferase [Calditrichales bacterium]
MVRRCLVVSYYFPPVGGGGVQRIVKMIKYVSRWGWQFTVITASEDAKTQPLDHSLQGEIPDNCQIIRLKSKMPVRKNRIIQKIPGLNDASYWKRWISAFLYIPDIRKLWIPPAKAAVYDELDKYSYDCILFTAPPYSLALLAAELQEKVSIPVILDMRDHWTTYPFKIYPTIYHRHKDRQLELNVVNKIEHGVSAYASLVEYYANTMPGFQTDRWSVIPNGFDEEDFSAVKRKIKTGSTFDLAFSGTFYSHINNPIYLFRAMAELNRINPETGKRIRFHHFGKSIINLDKIARRYGIQNQVQNHGYLPHKSCLRELENMDAFCIILDHKHIHGGNTIGGKVYEYLRLKKPILALVPEKGEAPELIEKTRSGQVIAPSQTAKIVQTLNDWVNQYPEFDFVGIENYSRERQAESFLKLLNKVSGA